MRRITAWCECRVKMEVLQSRLDLGKRFDDDSKR